MAEQTIEFPNDQGPTHQRSCNPESIPSGFLLAQAYRAMKARSEAAVLIPPSSERFGGYDGLTFEMEDLHLIEHEEYQAEEPPSLHPIEDEEPTE